MGVKLGVTLNEEHKFTDFYEDGVEENIWM
jgi:hypothetical protein